jgi:hypothetical protein
MGRQHQYEGVDEYGNIYNTEEINNLCNLYGFVPGNYNTGYKATINVPSNSPYYKGPFVQTALDLEAITIRNTVTRLFNESPDNPTAWINYRSTLSYQQKVIADEQRTALEKADRGEVQQQDIYHKVSQTNLGWIADKVDSDGNFIESIPGLFPANPAEGWDFVKMAPGGNPVYRKPRASIHPLANILDYPAEKRIVDSFFSQYPKEQALQYLQQRISAIYNNNTQDFRWKALESYREVKLKELEEKTINEYIPSVNSAILERFNAAKLKHDGLANLEPLEKMYDMPGLELYKKAYEKLKPNFVAEADKQDKEIEIIMNEARVGIYETAKSWYGAGGAEGMLELKRLENHYKNSPDYSPRHSVAYSKLTNGYRKHKKNNP